MDEVRSDAGDALQETRGARCRRRTYAFNAHATSSSIGVAAGGMGCCHSSNTLAEAHAAAVQVTAGGLRCRVEVRVYDAWVACNALSLHEHCGLPGGFTPSVGYTPH